MAPLAAASMISQLFTASPSSVFLHSGENHLRRSSVRTAAVREIFMPALSSTMTEGKVVDWLRSEGDKLKKGETVVVVESDKADMEVETFYAGYIAKILVEKGGVAPVGSAIALLAEKEEEIEEARSKASAAGPPAPVPAPESPKTEQETRPEAKSVVENTYKSNVLVATPHAKQLAKQYKVDISKVTGTGAYGRIVPADVQRYAGKPVSDATTVPGLQSAVAGEAKSSVDGAVVSKPEEKNGAPVGSALPPAPARVDSVVPFTSMQSAVSKNMVESLSVPTFRVGYTVSTNALDALYKKIKSKGVTMSALLAKAAALALVQHPVLNASCKDGKSFSYNSNINIAVAVAIDGGLITPVLQDADKVDIYSLSRKWKELVDKARAKQLQPQEYTTGTFTISNLGMFGVDRFDAILPPGQGAIMAVGASRPSVVGSGAGAFSVKSQMQVNVTADHRVIYGADLAAFLQTFAKIVEKPDELTL